MESLLASNSRMRQFGQIAVTMSMSADSSQVQSPSTAVGAAGSGLS